jgi:AraC family transcriptional activator of pyochelin receptor
MHDYGSHTDCVAAPVQEEKLYRFHWLAGGGAASNREPGMSWRQIDLGNGLWISKLELSPDFKSKLCYHKQPAMIDFGFILDGQLNHKLKTDVMGGRITASGGLSGIGYFPGYIGVMEVMGGKTLKVLHVHVTPERLNRMVGADIGGMPPDIRFIVEGTVKKDYLSKCRVDPVMQATALDVFNGRYHGIPQCLYLEGKAMELISLQLGRLMSAEINTQHKVSLSRNEKDRILAAHELLVSDLSEPPTLTELADHCCLSQNKLQTGFRELFGGSCLRMLARA